MGKKKEEVILVKRKRTRAKTRPPTSVLSVRVLSEIFDYKTQDQLRVMVQKAVENILIKYKASGKRKLTKK